MPTRRQTNQRSEFAALEQRLYRVERRPSGGGYTPPTASDVARITVSHEMDFTGISDGDSGEYFIEAWDFTLEGGSGAVHLDSPDDGDIVVDDDAIYAVTAVIFVEGMQDADAACNVSARVYWPPLAYKTFQAITRGGDADDPKVSASMTSFRAGGLPNLYASIVYGNIDLDNISSVTVILNVQQLGGTQP